MKKRIILCKEHAKIFGHNEPTILVGENHQYFSKAKDERGN